MSTKVYAVTCGQIGAIQGSVEILRAQSVKSGGELVRYAMLAKNGVAIECDDVIISTAGASAIVVAGNARIAIGALSRIEIAEHVQKQNAEPSLLHLTYGKLRAIIKKSKAPVAGPKPGISFRVRTLSAVVGVRGTDLFTGYDASTGLTEQATIEGEVEVNQVGTGQKVIVNSGQQVNVEVTPQALSAAKERLAKMPKVSEELPSQLPESSGPPKPLKVQPLQDSLKNEIRQASAIAKNEPEFTGDVAVKTLGQPAQWTMEREKVPEKLKNLKDEF